MPTEQNKAVVRRFIEDVWGKGQSSLLGQLVAGDVCDHNPAPGQPRGLEGQRWIVEQFRRAVPDLKLTLELLVAEGDLVTDHWTCSGTQTGELFGLSASGKRFSMTGTDSSRVENGKITEMWHQEDMLTMMQQLGAIPAMQQTGEHTGSVTRTQAPSRSSAGRPLPPDEKRSSIRRGYQELIDKARPSAADTLLTPDFQGHFSASPPVQGVEAFKQLIAKYNSALSNSHAELEDLIVEGDFAACRITFSGQHTGEFMGLAPTGKRVRVPGLSIFRFAGDRVAEQWANHDDAGLLQQLGAIPEMAGTEMAMPC